MVFILLEAHNATGEVRSTSFAAAPHLRRMGDDPAVCRALALLGAIS
jgi:hypothetical protein